MISYFLLCGYTPFDRDSNLEEMQAILVADYSFTPLEYWRHVSLPARQFVNRCLTIDSTQRMTAHQALSHPWITGEGEDWTGPEGVCKGKTDLLPTVKKNFNARRTLNAAIDTIRAINQLRAAGAAGLQPPGQENQTQTNRPGMAGIANAAMAANKGGQDGAEEEEGDAMEGVEKTPTQSAVSAAGMMPKKEEVDAGVGQLPVDPRGHAMGQTEEQIKEQTKWIAETSKGLWERTRR